MMENKVEINKIYTHIKSGFKVNVVGRNFSEVYYTCVNGVDDLSYSTDYYKFIAEYKLDNIVGIGSAITPTHYNSTKISTLDVINDPVNPSHYNGTEVLDQMILIYGVEAVKGFCICNAFKYRQRAGKKSSNIEEDIKKALWYEHKYNKLSER